MKSQYCCIGAALDVEGLSVVRFDLAETRYRIIKSESLVGKTSYSEVHTILSRMAGERDQIEVDKIYVLSNFSDVLKRYILNKWDSEIPLRIRTTSIEGSHQGLILNLINALTEKRLVLNSEEYVSRSALESLDGIDTEKLKRIYDGSDVLNQILEAILHSIGWLESRLIEERLV